MHMSCKFIPLSIVFVTFSAVNSLAAVIPSGTERWVAVGGTDAGDCSDKTSPCGSIQYAIGASVNGDVVTVNDGRYFGEITFKGKAITIQSVNGPKKTIIDGIMYGNWNLSAVTFDSGELSTSVLDGFTVAEGWSQYGGGIKVVDASPTIRNCIITNSWAGSGGGVYCLNSSPRIEGCTISNNGTGFDGGGIYNDNSSPTITNCTITDNEAKYGGGMYNVNSSPEISDSVIDSNYAMSDEEGHGGGIYNNTSSATLINCTITGNNASGYTEREGGGIHNVNSSIEITSCIISGNSAGTYGGGVYNESSSSTITDSTISDNSAASGGGIYNLDSSPEIASCTVSGNSAVSYGGGIYTTGSSVPTINSSTISSNSAADDGGGIYNYQTDLRTDRLSIKIVGSDIAGNSAGNNGGGIYNTLSSPEIKDCTISGNSAGADGGGIYNDSSSPAITNSTVSSNSADTDGGGVYNYYSWYLERLLMKITSCHISGNSAGADGGGIYNYSSSPAITNSTISGNSATLYGGGIYNNTSLPAITNCSLGGNSAVSGGGIYHYESTGRASIVNSILWGDVPGEVQLESSDITIVHSNIQGYWPGTGNINEDPLFIDPPPASEAPTTVGDYHLQQGSPCIDIGTDDATTYPTIPSSDIDGDARPQGLGWDMGSDEYAVANLWSGAADLGGGWRWFDWFGTFNLEHNPWVYHLEHGFLYPFGTSTDSIVFWDIGMNNFWWTSDTHYPYVYRFSDGEWLWYQEGSSGPRRFVRLSDGVWEQW